MHTSHQLLKFRQFLYPLLTITMLALPSIAHSAGAVSYSGLIGQAVSEDKIYLLENIRQKATLNSEKTVIEALMTEDGPKAAELFKKQLTLYPDPAMDIISKTRLADYKIALAEEPPLPKLSKALPARIASPAPAVQATPLQSALDALKKTAPLTPHTPERASHCSSEASAPETIDRNPLFQNHPVRSCRDCAGEPDAQSTPESAVQIPGRGR